MIPTQERSRLPIAFLAGIVIVALLAGGAVLYSRYATPAGSEDDKPLPVGSAELAYAPQIHFLEPKMSRAANFLNQEVTYVFCTVENGGDRKIHQIQASHPARQAAAVSAGGRALPSWPAARCPDPVRTHSSAVGQRISVDRRERRSVSVACATKTDFTSCH